MTSAYSHECHVRRSGGTVRFLKTETNEPGILCEQKLPPFFFLMKPWTDMCAEIR